MKDEKKTKAQLIAELKDLRQQLRDKTARNATDKTDAHPLKSLVALVGEGIVLVNEVGNIVLWNKAMEQISGYAGADVLGRPIWEVQAQLNNRGRPDSESEKELKKKIQGYLKSGRIPEGYAKMELPYFRPDGQKLLLQSSIYIVSVGDGYYLASLVRDVTLENLQKNVLDVQLALQRFGKEKPTNELLQYTVDEMQQLTTSEFGFFHLLAKDENTIRLQVWSHKYTPGLYGMFPDGQHLPVEKTNKWVARIRQREPIINNDSKAISANHKLPSGKAHLEREIILPVLHNDKIVAIVGVGNKQIPYTDQDVSIVRHLAIRAWEVCSRIESDAQIFTQASRLSELVKQSNEGIILTDTGGRVQMWNPRMEDLFGMSAAAVIGQPVWQVLYNLNPEKDRTPQLAKRLQQAMDHFYKSGEVPAYLLDSERPYRHPNGNELQLLGSMFAVKTKDGLQLAGIVRDVTEIRKKERQLQAAAGNWKTTFDAINDSVAIIDMDGHFLQYNAATPRLLSVTARHLKQKHCWQLVHGTDQPIEGCPITRMRQTHKRETMIFQDNNRWLEVTVDPVFDSEGQISTAVHVISDVTERQKTKLALQESEQKYKSLIDASPYISYIFSNKSGAIYWSSRIREVLGFEPDQLTQDPYLWYNAIHEDDRALVNKALKAIEQDELFDLHYRVQDRQGQWHWMRDQAIGLHKKEDEILIEGIAADMTAQKERDEELFKHRQGLEKQVAERTRKLEEQNENIRMSQKAMRFLLEDVNEARVELENSNRELTDTVQELEAFTYSVSHDLRAPLRAINGFSGKLERILGEQLDDEGRRLLGVIRGNTVKMNRLIEELLIISRISRYDIVRSKVDLVQLIDTIHEDLQNQYPDIPFEIEYGTLTSTSCDRRTTEQLFSNLLGNALKFSIGTGRTPKITVTQTNTGGVTEYCVADNGVGFDMKYADKIFDIFHRLHSGEEFEGTGVGLSIVKRIIQRHGGWIKAEAAPGVGSRFTFTLEPQKIAEEM